MRLYRLALALAFFLSAAVSASPTDPRVNVEYRLLSSPVPVQNSDGKVEVVEFFMYHCPFCNMLESDLSAWVKKQGDAIVFRRIHIPYTGANDPEAHLFLTLEAMGKQEAMHPKILNAVHVEHKRLMQDDAIVDWVGKNGINHDEFMNMWKSFSVTTKLARLPRTIQSYNVETAPTLVVNGRYLTSPSMAKGGMPDQSTQAAMKGTIEVLDALVRKAAEDNARRAK